MATAINSYDEYGIPRRTNTGRFQFTGQAWLGELYMYSYKARIYVPGFGRFAQTDPAGYPDGPNWYNYVNADPVNARDPSGLIPTCLSNRYDAATDSFQCTQWGESGQPAEEPGDIHVQGKRPDCSIFVFVDACGMQQQSSAMSYALWAWSWASTLMGGGGAGEVRQLLLDRSRRKGGARREMRRFAPK